MTTILKTFLGIYIILIISLTAFAIIKIDHWNMSCFDVINEGCE